MEIKINKINVAHQREKVIKIFDDSEECLKFAEKFEKKYGIKLSCDPLYSFLVCCENKGYFEGYKERVRDEKKW